MIIKIISFLIILTISNISYGYGEPDKVFDIIKNGGNMYVVEKVIKEADKIHIDGVCYSACTLVLLKQYLHKVTWTDDSFFAFHAVKNEVDGKININSTIYLYSDLPNPIKDKLPDMSTWTRNFIFLHGREVRKLLNIKKFDK